MKTWFSLSIVTVLALITFWLQDVFKETPIVPETRHKHFPDYFMDEFALTQMDEQGKPAYVLRARRLQHYGDTNSSEITEPQIHVHDPDGDLSIVARRALVQGDTDIIHLYDEVKIRRGQSPDANRLAIDTDYLKLDTVKKIAETDYPAHISTDRMELDSHGMVFDSASDILKLTSRVRGTHAPLQ